VRFGSDHTPRVRSKCSTFRPRTGVHHRARSRANWRTMSNAIDTAQLEDLTLVEPYGIRNFITTEQLNSAIVDGDENGLTLDLTLLADDQTGLITLLDGTEVDPATSTARSSSVPTPSKVRTASGIASACVAVVRSKADKATSTPPTSSPATTTAKEPSTPASSPFAPPSTKLTPMASAIAPSATTSAATIPTRHFASTTPMATAFSVPTATRLASSPRLSSRRP